MFGFGPSSAKKLAKKISNQMIGFQSVMYRMSYERLGVSEQTINRLEVTYYAMSLVTLSVLYLSKHKNKLAGVEQAQLDVLKASLPNAGTSLNLNAAVSQYQARFEQYRIIFDELITGKAEGGEVTLALLFVDNVSQGKAAKPSYIAAHQIFAQGVDDNLDFAKNVL